MAAAAAVPQQAGTPANGGNAVPQFWGMHPPPPGMPTPMFAAGVPPAMIAAMPSPAAFSYPPNRQPQDNVPPMVATVKLANCTGSPATDSSLVVRRSAPKFHPVTGTPVTVAEWTRQTVETNLEWLVKIARRQPSDDSAAANILLFAYGDGYETLVLLDGHINTVPENFARISRIPIGLSSAAFDEAGDDKTLASYGVLQPSDLIWDHLHFESRDKGSGHNDSCLYIHTRVAVWADAVEGRRSVLQLRTNSPGRPTEAKGVVPNKQFEERVLQAWADADDQSVVSPPTATVTAKQPAKSTPKKHPPQAAKSPAKPKTNKKDKPPATVPKASQPASPTAAPDPLEVKPKQTKPREAKPTSPSTKPVSEETEPKVVKSPSKDTEHKNTKHKNAKSQETKIKNGKLWRLVPPPSPKTSYITFNPHELVLLEKAFNDKLEENDLYIDVEEPWGREETEAYNAVIGRANDEFRDIALRSRWVEETDTLASSSAPTTPASSPDKNKDATESPASTPGSKSATARRITARKKPVLSKSKSRSKDAPTTPSEKDSSAADDDSDTPKEQIESDQATPKKAVASESEPSPPPEPTVEAPKVKPSRTGRSSLRKRSSKGETKKKTRHPRDASRDKSKEDNGNGSNNDKANKDEGNAEEQVKGNSGRRSGRRSSAAAKPSMRKRGSPITPPGKPPKRAKRSSKGK